MEKVGSWYIIDSFVARMQIVVTKKYFASFNILLKTNIFKSTIFLETKTFRRIKIQMQLFFNSPRYRNPAFISKLKQDLTSSKPDNVALKFL
jgi:hypothetical protein